MALTLVTSDLIGGLDYSKLTGTIPTWNQNTTGSAATLTTARNIGGISFNGSAAINLPGVNIAGNQNTSGTAAGLSATLAVGSGGTGVTSITALKNVLDDETWTFANKITTDAGIDIDNFNINGTTISLSSGNMILGTASAASALTISESGLLTMTVGSSSNPRLIFAGADVSGTHFMQINRGTSAMEFYVNGATRATISSVGAATFSTNSNSSIVNHFTNSNTTNTSTRNTIELTAGNRFLQLQAYNADHIYFNRSSGSSLYFQSGGSTQMIISSGGEATFNTTNTFPITIQTTGGNNGIKILTATNKTSWLLGAQYNVDNVFEITPSTAVGGSTFSNPALTISSGGNVGIGDSAFNYYANRLVLKASDEDGITFLSDAGHKFWLCFADGTVNHTQELAGFIAFDHGTNKMSIGGNAGFDWITLDGNGDITFANTSGIRLISYDNNQLYITNQHAYNAGASYDNRLIFEGRYRSSFNDATALGEIRVGKDSYADGYYGGNMQFWTRVNGGAIAERMRISTGGNLLVGSVSDITGTHYINKGASVNGGILYVGSSTTGRFSLVVQASDSGYNNSPATCLKVGATSSTSRSVSAAGTFNASGADYAEYMIKSTTDPINKGDIVGVNSDGLLTNIFNDAISFAIKSTDPSFVGNDTWGIESEDKDEIEEARIKVDRVAFSGQVPCNVTGASVGDYIIPVASSDGKITGEAVSNPTFEQYKISVGKVWKIMNNGNSWVAVKIG